jgi:protein-S-isoprenylcysteine O-methyltransferase Ste14
MEAEAPATLPETGATDWYSREKRSSMSDQSLPIKRPVRWAAICFAVLALPFIVCAFFVEDMEDFKKLVLFGLGYTLFLSVFSVGGVLALGTRLYKWWLRSSVAPLLVTAGIWLMIQTGPATITKPYFGLIIKGALVVLATWMLFSCVVAGSGWLAYFRGKR